MSSFDKNSNLSVIPVLRHCDVYTVNSVRNLLEILNRLSTDRNIAGASPKITFYRANAL